MDTMTLRLEEEELEALDAEADNRGFGNRSDYVRYILRHRDVVFEGDSPELEERVAELEDELHAIRQLLRDVEMGEE